MSRLHSPTSRVRASFVREVLWKCGEEVLWKCGGSVVGKCWEVLEKIRSSTQLFRIARARITLALPSASPLHHLCITFASPLHHLCITLELPRNYLGITYRNYLGVTLE